MKKLFAFTAAALACTLALAANELVSPHTPLLKLPNGSKLLLKQSINLSKMTSFSPIFRLGENSYIYTTSYDPITLPAGMALKINEVYIKKHKDSGILYLQFDLAGPYGLNLKDTDFEEIQTVGAFSRRFGDTLSIVYDDPDARLLDSMPEDMRQDFLMTRVLNAIKADRHAEALPDFERLEKLGKQQPESFYYYYIVALDKAQRPTQAKERAVEFLKTYGKQSKYYNDVLAIMAK